MKHIKNTWHLFLLDWKRVFKNPLATLLMLALMIIPSLYAWFNIKALWDPYGNTGEIPIAVYSDDKGTTFKEQEVDIGDIVIDELHDNKQLGWVFVDSKKALDNGVKSGKYYAGIYLPQDFSADLMSFTSGEITKPKIEYSLNQKINAIAPKITDKGASSIQSMISEEFIKTASSTLLKVFNEIGYDIDSNLVSINKLKTMILETDENLDTIDGYMNEVVALNQKMPDIEKKLTLANEFADYLPEVDALGQKIILLNDKMPQIKQEAKIILTLQEKIPELQNAGKQLAEIDEDFDSVEQTMNEGIDEAKQGLKIINGVQSALPDIEKLGNQANQLAGVTKDGAQELKNALPSITNSVGLTLNAIGEVGSATSSLTNTINQMLADGELTPEERGNIKQVLQDFSDNITGQQTAINSVIDFMTKLQNNSGNTKLQSTIDQLSHINSLLGDLQNRLNTLSASVDTASLSDIQNVVTAIGSAGAAIADTANQIDVASISTTIDNLLTNLIGTITTAQGLLNQAQQVDFQSLLSSTATTVDNAIGILEKYQTQMPAIKKEVHDANLLLNGNMDKIVTAINKGADLYNNTLPTLETKLNTAASFMQNDWPGIETDIKGTLTTINEKLPVVKNALATAVDLVNNDWPAIKTGIHKAAGAIREGESQADLGEIIQLLKLDATKESDFFATPVELKEHALYPIANNGSASTPFYTALCLWVGAVLFSSIATTDVYLEGKDKKRYSRREQFSARLLTFLAMGLAQGLIVSLGNIFLLHVDVAQPVYSVAFALLIALCFSMMVYVLVGLFGNIGKGLAIIILVLSISGGGGNYPIQVSGKFFQMINPFLPFTHAVNLLRESAGGIYWPNAWMDLFILTAIFVGFAIVGTWFYPLIVDSMKGLSKKSHESHIFH